MIFTKRVCPWCRCQVTRLQINRECVHVQLVIQTTKNISPKYLNMMIVEYLPVVKYKEHGVLQQTLRIHSLIVIYSTWIGVWTVYYFVAYSEDELAEPCTSASNAHFFHVRWCLILNRFESHRIYITDRDRSNLITVLNLLPAQLSWPLSLFIQPPQLNIYGRF